MESAIVQTLAPGAYTAILSGSSGLTGVALVEVYPGCSSDESFGANCATFFRSADRRGAEPNPAPVLTRHN